MDLSPVADPDDAPSLAGRRTFWESNGQITRRVRIAWDVTPGAMLPPQAYPPTRAQSLAVSLVGRYCRPFRFADARAPAEQAELAAALRVVQRSWAPPDGTIYAEGRPDYDQLQ